MRIETREFIDSIQQAGFTFAVFRLTGEGSHRILLHLAYESEQVVILLDGKIPERNSLTATMDC
jgi:predicted RNA binding protein YcfA (HicA-like mRNA interferase family)